MSKSTFLKLGKFYVNTNHIIQLEHDITNKLITVQTTAFEGNATLIMSSGGLDISNKEIIIFHRDHPNDYEMILDFLERRSTATE